MTQPTEAEAVALEALAQEREAVRDILTTDAMTLDEKVRVLTDAIARPAALDAARQEGERERERTVPRLSRRARRRPMAKSWVEMTGSDVMREWYREPGSELLAEFMERVIREVVAEVRAECAEATND